MNRLHYSILISLVVLTVAANAQFRRSLLSMPDTSDCKAIAAIVTQFYALLDAPAETIEASEFAQILIDAPTFPLTDGQRAFLTQTMGFKSIAQIGYLTYMQTEHRYQQQGQQLLTKALATAGNESRDVTIEEWAAIKQQNNGQLPPAPSDSSGAKTEVEIESIQFDGTQATVRYNTQSAYREAIMTKVENRWYIAGVKVIWAHF